MSKKLPTLRSDEEAEAFLDAADLSEYDLSEMKPIKFEYLRKSAKLNMRLPERLLAARLAEDMHPLAYQVANRCEQPRQHAAFCAQRHRRRVAYLAADDRHARRAREARERTPSSASYGRSWTPPEWAFA